MGDVKEAVKGTPDQKKHPDLKEGNLVEQFTKLGDTLSDLIAKKDEDVENEGKEAQPENMRKAALLRAVSGLVRSGKSLLEDY